MSELDKILDEINDVYWDPNRWCMYINEWGIRKGWDQNWDDPEKFMLIVTEIAEAMEEWRVLGGINCSAPEVPFSPFYMTVDERGNNKPQGVMIELVDAVIRIMHFFGHYGVDMNELLKMKMAYNENRPFRHGGKHA